MAENAQVSRGIRTALPRLSDRAARRRDPDEQLVVRFPALYRRLAARVMRLPPRSRVRQSVLARAMARAYAAANRRDFELVLTLNVNDGYEYRPSPDLLPPDMERVYHGHDGYRRFWRLWLDAFPDIRFDAEEMLDLGEKVLVTARVGGRGSASGVAVSELAFHLYTFRGGLLIRQEDFMSRDEALQAVGP